MMRANLSLLLRVRILDRHLGLAVRVKLEKHLVILGRGIELDQDGLASGRNLGLGIDLARFLLDKVKVL